MVDETPHEHVTELGCTLKMFNAPHLGDGVILRGQMEQPGDGRICEVYLSQEDLRWLVQRARMAGVADE